MNQTAYEFPQLADHRRRFTHSTHMRFGRALVDALRGQKRASSNQLEAAVGDASQELRLAGLDDAAVLALLGQIVEDTGRACGADRPSLLTGELRWVPVRRRVLTAARIAGIGA